MPTITFKPRNKNIQARQGETILRAASKARVVISQRCGGKGACTMCKVFVGKDSSVSPPKEAEVRLIGEQNLACGMRLACQTMVTGHVNVEVPESPLKAVVRAQLLKQMQQDA
ncbi:2Fe-2S iron-sulfur cluster-binding protein [Aneurinibacillus sp. Ricciae_BoGa-3]|uniref:2Fe-2S iron-sulfur cluster-binding protein n=1 Tax=Aneurinibacillus sp. Ricciae_BoGa-3 TaxID=3022697 RepID=UPI0023404D65|nr:2Fe-2S iron-sulfur cluster-binding protein [Aneurinibacillus sp. Ricciae_BoGa-3]WCK56071.1 2Fe-2S iron-sulfur cluster-binding protein [Aneurinibacillus sp. Ricciae_BoGa-3]